VLLLYWPLLPLLLLGPPIHWPLPQPPPLLLLLLLLAAAACIKLMVPAGCAGGVGGCAVGSRLCATQSDE
jgi:hypothetical protein